MENSMRGWISLHRKILDNPILKASKEYSRLEAFIWLLLRANHKEGKCVIGSTLYKVDKGEMITSQTKLMKQFKWSKSKLINFLNLLSLDFEKVNLNNLLCFCCNSIKASW